MAAAAPQGSSGKGGGGVRAPVSYDRSSPVRAASSFCRLLLVRVLFRVSPGTARLCNVSKNTVL